VWIDSMYMAPPFLAVAEHSEEAVKQIQGLRDLLWLPEKQLFAHIWDDGEQVFARKACWGVGNGWAAAGMTRVIRALPAEMMADKRRLVEYVKAVLDGCLIYQREDGLFHDVIDDASSFVETNLAQMLAYTIIAALRADGSMQPIFTLLIVCDRLRTPRWMMMAWFRMCAAHQLSTIPARHRKGRRFSC
jgi:unsaturated rhamnogalacturonyl hydrolase